MKRIRYTVCGAIHDQPLKSFTEDMANLIRCVNNKGLDWDEFLASMKFEIIETYED